MDTTEPHRRSAQAWAALLSGLLILAALIGLGGQRAPAARALSKGQTASLVLGQPNFTSRGLGAGQRALHNPTAVALDPSSGKLFVADLANNRVLRFASRAALSSGAAAEGVLGQPNYTSAAASTTAQGMWAPMGLTVDQAGRLWVVDRDNNRVLRFDSAAGKPNGAAADGVLGKSDFTNSATPSGGPQGLSYPTSVAADAAGRLWVADGRNNRVLRFDGAAGKPNGAAADGVLGQSDLLGDSWGSGAARMFRPYGVLADTDGRLWVADTSNNRVLRFDSAAGKPNGAAADGVLGQPSFTDTVQRTTAQGMIGPLGLALDAGGRLLVSDGGNNRLLWFGGAAGKPNGAAADGVLGQPDFTSKQPGLSASAFNLPFGLALGADGRLWLADATNNRALLFDPDSSVVPRVYLPRVARP